MNQDYNERYGDYCGWEWDEDHEAIRIFDSNNETIDWYYPGVVVDEFVDKMLKQSKKVFR